MRSPDNFAALIYLKDKLHKWKNIAIMLAVFSVLLLLHSLFGSGPLSGDLVHSDYIAEIKIEGVIFEDDYRSKVLAEVLANRAIKAVIVNVNSPGGGIVGSEILYNELAAIAKEKPIVVTMGSLAASGGYMIAVAADHLIAHNGTLTGSIGVLMESAEVTELANKLGVKLTTYKSSIFKGSPSPFEKSNPMVDRAIGESIADSYKFFVELVRERRGAKIKNAEAFDGRVFTGRQALRLGLVDEIGGKDAALNFLASKKIDVKNLPLIEVEVVEQEHHFLEKFLGFLPFFNGAKSSNFSGEIMAIMPR